MEPAIQIIIGLGNPEEKYEGTPHNIGRALVDFIAGQKGWSWSREKWFDVSGDSYKIARPATYMNESGRSVLELIKKFNCGPENILVCVDDFDIPLGALRIRKKGSAGTHNGLKSVIAVLGTQEFPRMRLGVGPLLPGQDAARYVLAPFSKSNRVAAAEAIGKAALAVENILSAGLDEAMNKFNVLPSPESL